MEQSPSWKANSSSASQEIPGILCDPKIHHHVNFYLSSATLTQSTISAYLTCILVLSSHLLLGFPSGLFLTVFPPKLCIHFTSAHTCHISRPSHPSNDICWNVQIIKLLIMRLPSFPCHFQTFSSKHPSQHPMRDHPQPMFFCVRARPCFIPLQRYRSIQFWVPDNIF